MATLYEKLETFLSKKRTVTGLYGSRTRKALEELLTHPRTRTGFSMLGKKEIWTDTVSAYLAKLGIAHKCGNDAPRGGANGEFVEITSKAFVRDAKKAKAAADAIHMAEMERAKAEADARRAQKEDARRTYVESMVKRYGEDWKIVIAGKADALLETDEAKEFISQYISDNPDATILVQCWNGTKFQYKPCLTGYYRNKLAMKLARHFKVGYSHSVISVALKSYVL